MLCNDMNWSSAVSSNPCSTFNPGLHLPAAFGVVRNPYDLDRSTAGSSGGPAAAASANFGMISLGSDTGNSIRGPSGHNGLVGIRSSIGQTSRSVGALRCRGQLEPAGVVCSKGMQCTLAG